MTLALTLPSKHFTQLTRLAISYVNSKYIKGVLAKELRVPSSSVRVSRKYLSDYDMEFSVSRDLSVYTQTFKYSADKGVSGDFTLELFLWVDSEVLGYSSDILGASLSVGGNTRELAYNLSLEDSLTHIMGTLSRFSRYMLGWLGVPSLKYSRDSGSKVHLTYGTVLNPNHTDIKFKSDGSVMPLSSHTGSLKRTELLESLESYSESLVRDGHLLSSSVYLVGTADASDDESSTGGSMEDVVEGTGKSDDKVVADVDKPKAKDKDKDTVVGKAPDTKSKPRVKAKPRVKEGIVGKVIEPKAKPKAKPVVKVKPTVDTVDDTSKPKAKRGRPRKTVVVEDTPKPKVKVEETPKPRVKSKAKAKPTVDTVGGTSKPKAKRGRPRKTAVVEDALKPKGNVEETPKPKAKRGRPRKKVVVEDAPKPKGKVEETPKPKRGRPRKTAVVEETPKAKRGRPRKTAVVEETPKPKANRGRPKTKVK